MDWRKQKQNCRSKKKYDKKGAQTIRNALWRMKHEDLKIYPCPFGSHWHLTSTGNGQ